MVPAMRPASSVADFLRAPVGKWLVALQTLLRACSGNVDISAAASQLAMATRSLQRHLSEAGTSFREVQAQARFRAVSEMLTQTDLKIAAVAAKLGISEGALNKLVQDFSGLSPAEFRRQAAK